MSSIVDLLRSVGVKVTPGRVRVLDALRVAVVPLSHADIEALLPDADRVTLYRVLDTLVSSGLAIRTLDARGVFRFIASDVHQDHRGHMHFRCTDCGAAFCLKDAPPPAPELPQGFRLQAVDYDIRGLCADCCQRPDDA